MLILISSLSGFSALASASSISNNHHNDRLTTTITTATNAISLSESISAYWEKLHEELLQIVGELVQDNIVNPLAVAKNNLNNASSSSTPFYNDYDDDVYIETAAIKIQTTWPQEATDTNHWIGYAIFIALMTFVPIVVGVILCAAECCIFCCGKQQQQQCCCGGGFKPRKEGYKAKSRTIVYVAYLIASTLILIWAIIAIVFNGTFSLGVGTVARSSFGALDRLISLFQEVTNEIDGLNTAINSTVAYAHNITSDFSRALDPIYSMRNRTQQIDQQHMVSIQNHMDLANSNASAARDNLQVLNKRETEGKVHSSPPYTMVQTINVNGTIIDDIRDKLAIFNASMNDLTDQINRTLEDVANSANSFIDELQATVTGRVDDILSNVITYLDKVGNSTFVRDRKKYKSYVDTVESVRAVLVTLFLLFAAVLYAIGMVAACAGRRGVIKLVAVISHLILLWYFVWFGVSMGVYSVADDFCKEKEPALQRYIPSEAVNITFKVIRCAGDTTLFDVVGFDPQYFNLSDTFEKYRSDFEAIIARINVDQELQATQDALDVLVSTSASSFNASLAEPFIQLADYVASNVTVEENNLTVYDPTFDAPAYDTSIENLNNVTSNFTYTDAATGNTVQGSIIYSRINASQFDPSEYPYNATTDPATLLDLQANYADVHPRATQYDAIQAEIDEIKRNISATVEQLTQVSANINTTQEEDIQGGIQAQAALIKEQDVQGVANFVDGKADQMRGVLDRVRGLLDTVMGFAQFGKCDWVGDTYNNIVNKGICTQMIVATHGIGWMCGLTGITMFCAFPILLLLIQRLGRKYRPHMQEGDTGYAVVPPSQQQGGDSILPMISNSETIVELPPDKFIVPTTTTTTTTRGAGLVGDSDSDSESD